MNKNIVLYRLGLYETYFITNVKVIPRYSRSDELVNLVKLSNE